MQNIYLKLKNNYNILYYVIFIDVYIKYDNIYYYYNFYFY